MPVDFSTFGVDSSKAVYIPVPSPGKAVVSNVGSTVYYKSTSDVTSSSNDGSIASAGVQAFVKPVFVITATGTTSQLAVTTTTSPPGTVPSVDRAASFQPIAATSGTDTAFANGTLFVCSVEVPQAMTVSKIGYLLGSVGGTDKVIGVLYDDAGRVIANTTTASSGTTAGTAANTQEIALATPASSVVIPPGKYYIGIAGNTGTAKLRTVIAFCNAGLSGASQSWTHGTIANITPPTTFTADQAPIAYLV